MLHDLLFWSRFILFRLLPCLCLSASAGAAATSVTFSGSGRSAGGQTDTLNSVSGSGQGTLAPWGTVVFGFSGTSPRGVANKISTGSVSIVLQNGVNNGDTLELNWSVPDQGCCSVDLKLTVSGGTGIFASASGQMTLNWTGFPTGPNAGIFTVTGTGSISGPPTPTTPLSSAPGNLGDPLVSGSVSCGQPVTVTNGNMYHSFRDVLVPSRGFPLLLERTYNSQSTADSPFGIGWTHSYRRSLTPVSTTIVYHDELGGAYTFAGTSAGYIAAPGLNMTLQKDSSGYSLARRNGTAMRFDSTGRLTTITDRNGNQQTLTYSGNNLASVADAAGGMLRFQYDTSNHITSVQDQSGRTFNYQYDSGGYLTASVDSVGSRTTYTWYTDSAHLLKAFTLPDGETTTYQYDSNKRVVATVDPGNGQMQFAYGNGTTTVTDARGFITRYDYNAAGNLTHITKADGSAISHTWNENAEVTSVQDAAGFTSAYTYDSNSGNLLSITDPLKAVTTYTYTPTYNQVASVTDPKSNLTTMGYDNRGNLVRVTDPTGAQTTFTYDTAGEVTSITDGEGVTRRMTYDSRGGLTQIQDGAGNSTQTRYDARERLVSVTDPLNHQTLYGYDNSDRVTRVTAADGTLTQYAYDPRGRLLQTLRPDGKSTLFSYDQLGNLAAVTDALGRQTRYEHQAGPGGGAVQGKPTKITDALGRTTSFTYGLNDRVAGAQDALGNTLAWSYDGRGDIVKLTDENGKSATFQYDGLRRLLQAAFADGTTQTYTYDANGNLLTAANQNVTLTFTYDARNLRTSVTDSRFKQTILYTYDRAGHLKTMTNPAGGVTTYTRNAAGQLTQITGPNGEVFQMQYDALGRRSKIALPNGIAGQYSYDAVGRLTGLAYTNSAGTTVAQALYTYDALGNRTSATDVSGAHQYQFDALNRLIGAVDASGAVETFSYDAVGNRTAGNGSIVVDNGDRLLSASGVQFSYDNHGNTLSRNDPQAGASSYQYDTQNRLIGVTLADGTAVSYKYDALGRRIEKNVGGKVTAYLYDGMHVLWEEDGSGQAVASYLHGPGIDQQMEMSRGGQPYYYLVDGLGSVTALTDGTGALIQSYGYSSFGKLSVTAGNGTPVMNPFTYTGREWDAETGLYYYRARYYDPGTGRFLSKDPLWLPYAMVASRRNGTAGAVMQRRLSAPESSHPYAYAANNPVTRFDQFGLQDTGTSNSDTGGPLNTWATCQADNTTPAPDQSRDLQVTGTTDPSVAPATFQPFTGLLTVTIYTANGPVMLNIPEDMSAGDLVSGVTVTLGGGPDPQYTGNIKIDYNHVASGGTEFDWNISPELRSGNSTVILTEGNEDIVNGTPPADTSSSIPPAGPGTLGNPSTTGGTSVGDPVSVTNGNVYFPILDLLIPSRGFPIALQRTYNGQQSADSPFGVGWTHSYRRYLTQSGTTLIYHDESGGAYPFALAGNVYAPAPGLDMTLQHDALGYVMRRPNGTEMRFDSGGRLQTVTDRNGNQQRLTYSGNNLVTVADSIGDSLQFQYDASNHVTSIQDQAGRILRYQYDAAGHLSASVDTGGNRTTYAWNTDSAHLLQSITFADGGLIAYEYDSSRRAVHTVDQGGADLRFSYSNGVTTVTDERGFTTQYQYNVAGNLTRIARPDGSTVDQTWNADEKLVTLKDADGFVSSFVYDTKGNLLSAADALGGIQTYSYEPVYNQMTSVTDANGNMTSLQYDARGNLILVTDPAGAQTTIVYDAAGDVLSVTDPEGGTLRLSYDSNGTLTEVRDAAGNATRPAYDVRKRLASVTDPLNHQMLLQYDNSDRLTKRTAADGTAIQYGYDPLGRLLQLTRPDGMSTAYSYDHLGNLVSVADMLGNQTAYQYLASAGNQSARGSVQGALSQITDALGRNTALEYGPYNEISGVQDALGNTLAWSYDGRGDIIKLTDENGKSATFQYDGLRRLLQASFADGTTQIYTYDANGNLLTAANQNVTLTFTYDARNLRTSVTDSRFQQAILYTYDRAGRLKTMTNPTGGVTTYTRNAAGQLTQITGPNDEVFQMQYDALGRRSKITLPNGITGQYSYDAVGRLTGLVYANSAGTTVAQAVYTYDTLGNRTSATDVSGAHQYQFDALNRLIGAVDPSGAVETFSYDAVGNRTAGNGSIVVDNGDRLLSASGVQFSYDNHGNTLSRNDPQTGALSYQYDAQNRLTGVTLADGTAVSYKYDALGRRIEKNVGGKVTAYLYDGLHVLWEEDGSGQPVASYLHGPGIDQQMEMSRGGQPYYYLVDGLGSVTALTDGTGVLIQSYGYSSFGKLSVMAASGAPVANPFTYTGREWDAETGLYYYRARYYDPGMGRFLSKDPLWLPYAMVASRRNALAAAVLQNSLASPQFAHAYAYVENNPVTAIDPLGLTSTQVLTQPTDTRDLQVTGTGTTSSSSSPTQFYPFVALVTETFHTSNGDVTVTHPFSMLEGQSLNSGTTVTLMLPIDRTQAYSGGQPFPAPGYSNLSQGNTTVTLTGP